MKSFKKYLDQSKEIGVVEELHHSITFVSGLPGAKTREMVVFENGELGQVFNLSPQYAEILVFSKEELNAGMKVARTSELLSVDATTSMLGKTVDSLGFVIGGRQILRNTERRLIDTKPLPITRRRAISEPFETGVSLVDLVIPLGRGQRELVIGDRKTGKTSFILKAMISQAKAGAVCIYAAIGKKLTEIKGISESFAAAGILNSTVVVAASASDAPGKTFIAPYTAMTLAEYFRDQNYHVFLVLDDLTSHARVYREISLLARRFPGRSSYPGDIFYTHARLLERAGNFENASITCMPIAESVQGDLSGYIQTNVMAMTDGHIFFDTDLFDEGRRPAISPFLSVTRAGRQASSRVVKEISRELSSFLVRDSSMRQFMKFGAELTEQVKQSLALGDRVQTFFQQPEPTPIPLNVNIIIFASLWSGMWKEVDNVSMKQQIWGIVNKYGREKDFRATIDNVVGTSQTFADVVNYLRENDGRIGKYSLEQK